MSITKIEVTASKSVVFNESRNISIDYNTINSDNFQKSIHYNNTSNLFNYSNKNSKNHIRLIFNYYGTQYFNLTEVTATEYDALSNNNLVNKVNILAFNDEVTSIKNTKSNIIKKNINSIRSIENNDKYTEYLSRPFYDRENPIHNRNILLEDFSDPDFEYAFSFNYTDFAFRGGRIDAFSNISKLQLKDDYIDKLKGIKINNLGKGKSAFGFNNIIKNYYKKSDKNSFVYSDDIDEIYLTSTNFKHAPVKKSYQFNFSTLTYTEIQDNQSNFQSVHSSDARYFNFEEISYEPFYDISYDKNYWWVDNSKYVFTDSVINDTILQNRGKNSVISEDVIFASHGRDINKDYGSGRDSIGFYESID